MVVLGFRIEYCSDTPWIQTGYRQQLGKQQQQFFIFISAAIELFSFPLKRSFTQYYDKDFFF